MVLEVHERGFVLPVLVLPLAIAGVLVGLKSWIEMLELLLGVHLDPILQELKRDALVGRPERDDLVDVIGGVLLERRIGDLDRLANEQAAHGVGDDVHLRFRLRGAFERAQVANESDQAHQRLPIRVEAAVVEIVVAEDPQRLAWVGRRPHQIPRHRGVDDDAVAGEVLGIEVLELGGQPVGRDADVPRIVSDDVRRVLILPVRFHEPQDQTFVDVVLAALLRIDRAVVEALIGDPLLVFDAAAAEAADQD